MDEVLFRPRLKGLTATDAAREVPPAKILEVADQLLHGKASVGEEVERAFDAFVAAYSAHVRSRARLDELPKPPDPTPHDHILAQTKTLDAFVIRRRLRRS